jgi:hypothetical protein
MLAQKYKETFPLLLPVKHSPCVSVIMPFEPKMNSREAVAFSLKRAVDTIRRDLYENFSKDVADEVLQKLQNVIDHLDYSTHKKSIALYVSATIEKVYYLDIEVREKIMTDTSLEIRDVVMNKKDERRFLVLVISGKKEKIYTVAGNKFQLITSNSVAHVERDLPEPVGNFTDAATIKEVRLKIFLRYIDNNLSNVLKFYPMPLFMITSKKNMGYFQSITKHHKNIAGFVHGNFDNATENELLKALEPQLKNWNAIREDHLQQQLKIARDENKLITGIRNVWIRANWKHKQLLVVEKDFYCPALITEKGETVFADDDKNNVMIAKDAVDDVIEKVLANGGDVEFVDDLKDYNRIALMDCYNMD